jgi:hypothetical protein
MTLGLGAATPALAIDGLEWQWADGQERRFLMQTEFELSDVMFFNAERNAEIRITYFTLVADITCSPRLETKSGWELACEIGGVSLSAAPIFQDAERLPEVLAEMDEKFETASLEVTMGRDGRVKALGLEGISQRNRRISIIQEVMRLIIGRGIAGLDLQLPPKGTDKDRGLWKQKASMAMALPSNQGTMGGAMTTHRVSSNTDGVVNIVSEGEGTLGAGEMIMVGGVERPRNLFSMTFAGSARFDTVNGHLVERQYIVEGVPTASSVSAEAIDGAKYQQATVIQLIEADREIDLGPSVALAPGATMRVIR